MNRKSIEDYVWKFFHRNTCYSPEFSPCSGNPNYGPPAESSYLYVDTKPITPDHIENTFFKTLLTRKSQREYSNSPLLFSTISTILFYSNGYVESPCSGKSGRKIVPSAGARFPIEMNLFAFNCQDLSPRTYHNNNEKNILETKSKKNYQTEIADLCGRQNFLARSSAVLAICARFENMIEKYGARGYRYTLFDAGHVAQNIYLICSNLNLACVGLGGFDDFKIRSSLHLPKGEYPVYLLAIGNIQEG